MTYSATPLQKNPCPLGSWNLKFKIFVDPSLHGHPYYILSLFWYMPRSREEFFYLISYLLNEKTINKLKLQNYCRNGLLHLQSPIVNDSSNWQLCHLISININTFDYCYTPINSAWFTVSEHLWKSHDYDFIVFCYFFSVMMDSDRLEITCGKKTWVFSFFW